MLLDGRARARISDGLGGWGVGFRGFGRDEHRAGGHAADLAEQLLEFGFEVEGEQADAGLDVEGDFAGREGGEGEVVEDDAEALAALGGLQEALPE